MNVQPKGKTNRRASPIAVIGGIILAGFVILGIYAKYVQDSSAPPKPDPSSALEVTDLKFQPRISEGDPANVEGTLVNHSDQQFSYVEVDVNFYDSNGTQVDSVIANAADLAPHGSWSFEATSLKSTPHSAKVTKITGVPRT
jgi:hypothetical protein